MLMVILQEKFLSSFILILPIQSKVGTGGKSEVALDKLLTA